MDHHQNYQISENGKYQCLICNKELSTKQRVLTHLQCKKHGLGPLKRVKKRYIDDETVPVPRSTLHWRQNKSSKITTDTDSHDLDLVSASKDELESSITLRNLQDKSETSRNPKNSNELQDVTNTLSSISNIEVADNFNKFSLVQCCMQQPMDPESSLSAVNNFYENSSCSEHFSGETHLLSDDENNDTCSVASDNNLSDSDSTCSSNLILSESDDSEDDIVSDSSKPPNLPTQDYQALSLMSCFLRNKLSNSACKDIIDTLSEIFSSEELSSLNYNEIMSRIDLSPLHEVHVCSNCNTMFPEDEDIYLCSKLNCNGLRYKGSLAAQTHKTRRPVQMFVFGDVKTQLISLLETPGIWKDVLEAKEAAFDRFESGSTVLTDIMDGLAYRSMMVDGGFLSKSSQNLTAIFNTDGVNLFSSSKIDLWPIFIAINELRALQNVMQ